jgi:hypothetical protein
MPSTPLPLLIFNGGIQNLKTGVAGEIRDVASEVLDVPTRIDGRVDRGWRIHSHAEQQVDIRVRVCKNRPCPIRNVRNKDDAGGDNRGVEAISSNTRDKMKASLELNLGFFDV